MKLNETWRYISTNKPDIVQFFSIGLYLTVVPIGLVLVSTAPVWTKLIYIFGLVAARWWGIMSDNAERNKFYKEIRDMVDGKKNS